LQLKEKRIGQLEAYKASLAKGPKEDKAQGSLMTSLINKIVDNVQIVLNNVHIRYEDNISIPSMPFAFGITLERWDAPPFLNTIKQKKFKYPFTFQRGCTGSICFAPFNLFFFLLSPPSPILRFALHPPQSLGRVC
jgi:hypothetical protein